MRLVKYSRLIATCPTESARKAQGLKVMSIAGLPRHLPMAGMGPDLRSQYVFLVSSVAVCCSQHCNYLTYANQC